MASTSVSSSLQHPSTHGSRGHKDSSDPTTASLSSFSYGRYGCVVSVTSCLYLAWIWLVIYRLVLRTVLARETRSCFLSRAFRLSGVQVCCSRQLYQITLIHQTLSQLPVILVWFEKYLHSPKPIFGMLFHEIGDYLGTNVCRCYTFVLATFN